jgi:hypothetical protein
MTELVHEWAVQSAARESRFLTPAALRMTGILEILPRNKKPVAGS